MEEKNLKYLPKGTKLYLKWYNRDGTYRLKLWHTKLDNLDFGWWDNRGKGEEYVKMCTERVLSKHMSHFLLLFPDDWTEKDIGRRVEIDGDIGIVNKLLLNYSENNFFRNLYGDDPYYKIETYDEPQIGIHWIERKQPYLRYFWQRFDKIKKL